MLMWKARGQKRKSFSWMLAEAACLSNTRQYTQANGCEEKDYLPAGCFLPIAACAAGGTSVKLTTEKKRLISQVFSFFSHFCLFLVAVQPNKNNKSVR